MENLTQKPTIKTTSSEQRLSFNEWSEKLNVSSKYIEPTKYFQGNPSSGIKAMKFHSSPLEKFLSLFSLDN